MGSGDLEHDAFKYGGQVSGYPVSLTAVSDSFDAPVSVGGAAPSQLTTISSAPSSRASSAASVVQNNTVSNGSIDVHSEATPEVTGSGVNVPSGGAAYAVGFESLDLADSSGNTASGSGGLGFGLSGSLAVSGAWLGGSPPTARLRAF